MGAVTGNTHAGLRPVDPMKYLKLFANWFDRNFEWFFCHKKYYE